MLHTEAAGTFRRTLRDVSGNGDRLSRCGRGKAPVMSTGVTPRIRRSRRRGRPHRQEHWRRAGDVYDVVGEQSHGSRRRNDEPHDLYCRGQLEARNGRLAATVVGRNTRNDAE